MKLPACLAWLGLLAVCLCPWMVQGCGPGPGYGMRPRPRKLTPMRYKQQVPNLSENNLGASGRAEGKITRYSERFNELVCNYNPDIKFKDEENTKADRFMTKRCKDSLNKLAIAVMNQWPGVYLRVTEAWDEDGHHPPDSLHYEGRAVDITTDPRRPEKYGLLAQLAVEAGFDWVYYESKSHVHCSVKADHSMAVEKGGCFPSWVQVSVAGGGKKAMSSLAPGEKVMALSASGQVVLSTVLLFLHRNPDSKTVFLLLKTEDGHTLALTTHHMVFLSPLYQCHHGEYRAQFASRAKNGDYVLIHGTDGQVQPSKIISVQLKEDVGVYAPLTEDGTLFVNGVLASSYALVEDHRLAHWAFGPLRLLGKFTQLVWGESTERGEIIESKTRSHCSRCEVLQAEQNKTFNNRGVQSSRHCSNGIFNLTIHSIDKTETLCEWSGIHWYPRLLHSLAHIFLDLKGIS